MDKHLHGVAIYPFVMFADAFGGEKETWVRNRKSLHTACDELTSLRLLTLDI